MKNLAIIISLILIVACAEIPETQRSVFVTGFDFTEYSKKGFLFTPETYVKDYEAIGLISATIMPAIKKSEYGIKKEGYISMFAGGKYYDVEIAKATDAVEEIYKVASKMGADAIINFSSKIVFTQYDALSVPTYEVTGFAIKRTK